MKLIDARYMEIDHPGSSTPATLDVYLGDEILGALSHSEWLEFERNGYTFGPVHDPSSRELIAPDDVILAQLDARKAAALPGRTS